MQKKKPGHHLFLTLDPLMYFSKNSTLNFSEMYFIIAIFWF